MANYISFRDIQFTPAFTSVTVIAVTDIPCHLWLRLTTVQPQIHKKTSLVRGLRLLDDFRYCFVSYEDNEQQEAGDTLIHTWVKPDWPFCITKWFYLWGYIAGIVSPSTSPVFKYHNTFTGLSFTLIFSEPWTLAEPTWGLIFSEPWTASVMPWGYGYIKITEHWSS